MVVQPIRVVWCGAWSIALWWVGVWWRVVGGVACGALWGWCGGVGVWWVGVLAVQAGAHVYNWSRGGVVALFWKHERTDLRSVFAARSRPPHVARSGFRSGWSLGW